MKALLSKYVLEGRSTSGTPQVNDGRLVGLSWIG
jgi:hypothetical protein